jgi:hypothetical protein
MLAASSGSIEAIELLLDRAPRLNLRDDDGRTALMIAASLNDRRAVEVLLAKGAIHSVRDQQGRSAEDLATCPVVQKLLMVSGPITSHTGSLYRCTEPSVRDGAPQDRRLKDRCLSAYASRSSTSLPLDTPAAHRPQKQSRVRPHPILALSVASPAVSLADTVHHPPPVWTSICPDTTAGPCQSQCAACQSLCAARHAHARRRPPSRPS